MMSLVSYLPAWLTESAIGQWVAFRCFQVVCSVVVSYTHFQKVVTNWIEPPKYKEPFEATYTNEVSLVFDDDGYKNHDMYRFVDTTQSLLLQTQVDDFFTRNDVDPNVIERLFVVKTEDRCRVLLYFSQKPHLECDIEFIRSRVEFLFIEYSHPDMEENIELVLPDEMYLEGNELFSPSFVLRLLEKQCVNYKFDEDYTLSLLDSTLQKQELSMHEYIRLQKKQYTVETNTAVQRHLEAKRMSSTPQNNNVVHYPLLFAILSGGIQSIVDTVKGSIWFYWLFEEPGTTKPLDTIQEEGEKESEKGDVQDEIGEDGESIQESTDDTSSTSCNSMPSLIPCDSEDDENYDLVELTKIFI